MSRNNLKAREPIPLSEGTIKSIYITIRSLFRVESQEDTVCEVPRTQVSFILLVDFEYRRWADSSNFCCWG